MKNLFILIWVASATLLLSCDKEENVDTSMITTTEVEVDAVAKSKASTSKEATEGSLDNTPEWERVTILIYPGDSPVGESHSWTDLSATRKALNITNVTVNVALNGNEQWIEYLVFRYDQDVLQDVRVRIEDTTYIGLPDTFVEYDDGFEFTTVEGDRIVGIMQEPLN